MSPRPPFRAAGGLGALELIRHLPDFARLYWRLIRDARVPIWPKLVLLGGILYVLSPIDVITDLLPIIGQIDDLVVLLVVCRLFVYLCPPAVVREHVARIAGGSR